MCSLTSTNIINGGKSALTVNNCNSIYHPPDAFRAAEIKSWGSCKKVQSGSSSSSPREQPELSALSATLPMWGNAPFFHNNSLPSSPSHCSPFSTTSFSYSVRETMHEPTRSPQTVAERRKGFCSGGLQRTGLATGGKGLSPGRSHSSGDLWGTGVGGGATHNG